MSEPRIVLSPMVATRNGIAFNVEFQGVDPMNEERSLQAGRVIDLQKLVEVEASPPSKLQPHPSNWRSHPKEQADALRGILSEVGLADAVIARELEDGSLQLIDGHLRAETLGDTQVPVLVLDVDEQEAAKLLVTLDPLSGLAGRADELLRGLLESVSTESEALQAMLDGLLPGVEELPEKARPDPGAQTDRAAELRRKWGTEPGQVWQVGRHRLMCGSSTSREDMATLLGGATPRVAVTDPPYGVAYEKSHETRGGDLGVHSHYNEGESADILQFLQVIPCDVVVMSYPIDRHFFDLASALLAAKFEFRKELVWVKNVFSFWPGAQYQQKHEPILVLAREGRPIGSSVPANETTVQEFPKPVELYAKLVRFHTDHDEAVIEPFCGSGTTMVACEQEGRTCYGMELSPEYCAVILERLTGMGLEASLLDTEAPAQPVEEPASAKKPRRKGAGA